jgi:hypothetical protein
VRKQLVALALVGGIVGGALSRPVAAGANPFLEVKKTAGGYTVEAENTTLPQVLSALGEQAGFSVQDSGAVRPPIPFFEANDATLESMLRRLLVSTNHLIVYRGKTNREIAEGSIERIVLLSPVERRQAPPPQPGAGATSSLAGPPGTQAPPRNAPQMQPPPNQPPPQFVPPGMAGDGGNPPGVPPPLPEPQTAFPPGTAPGSPGTTAYSDATLAEMERQALDQLGVGSAEVTGEPGAQPEIPPDLRERLRANGYGYEGEIPPPEQ